MRRYERGLGLVLIVSFIRIILIGGGIGGSGGGWRFLGGLLISRLIGALVKNRTSSPVIADHLL